MKYLKLTVITAAGLALVGIILLPIIGRQNYKKQQARQAGVLLRYVNSHWIDIPGAQYSHTYQGNKGYTTYVFGITHPKDENDFTECIDIHAKCINEKQLVLADNRRKNGLAVSIEDINFSPQTKGEAEKMLHKHGVRADQLEFGGQTTEHLSVEKTRQVAKTWTFHSATRGVTYEVTSHEWADTSGSIHVYVPNPESVTVPM
jgi:hypothetical protein